MARFSVTKNHPDVRLENGIWKGPSVVPPAGYHRLGEMLLKTMKENSEVIAQIDPVTGYEDTYGSMADRCIRCALWLQKQGICPGDVIGLCTVKHINAIVPVISSIMIGAVGNLWWNDPPKELLLEKAATTRPKILFIERTNAKFIQQTFREANVNVMLVSFQKIDGFKSFNEILEEQDADEVAQFKCFRNESPDTPAVLVFPSGTSGGPLKGVLLPCGSFAHTEDFIPPLSTGNRYGMIIGRFEWISAIQLHIDVIKAAATLILCERPISHNIYTFIEKYKVHWIRMTVIDAGITVTTENIAKYDFSSVKYVRYGGAAVTDTLMKKMCDIFSSAEVHYSYGMTENAGRISEQIGCRKYGCSGKISMNTELKIINEDGKINLAPCQVGQLYVRSPRLFIKYYNNPKATAESFDAQGWLRTGDYGYVDEEGDLYILDRYKDLLNYSGVYESSTLIEKIILEHPEVLNVGVVMKLCSDNREIPMAYVVRKPYSDVTEKDILNLLKNRRSSRIFYYSGGGVEFVDSLPTNPRGKVQKAKLRMLVSCPQIY